MSKALDKYIDRVMLIANPSEKEEQDLRDELKDHLLTKIDELENAGVSREDAIFEAIENHGSPITVGYGLRKFAWIDIRSKGVARGVIAIGPRAVGVVACGGAAFGVFAFGGFAAGLVAVGGFSIGLLLAFAGFAISLLGYAYGGLAIGVIAAGGAACGIMAAGGTAVGVFADGATAIKHLPISEAPKLLGDVGKVLLGKKGFFVGTIVFWGIWAIFMVVSTILPAREMKRIKKIDPHLFE